MKIKNKILNKIEKFLFILYVVNRFSYGSNPLVKIRLIDSFMDEWRKIDRRYEFKDLYEDMYYCKRKGYLNFKYSKQEGFIFNFTEKGILKLLNKEPLLNKEKWKKIYSGVKSIVFFDIPEVLRGKRNKFRKLLKIMGYKEVQKSVFLGDYENFEDVNFIARAMGLSDYIETGYFKKEL